MKRKRKKWIIDAVSEFQVDAAAKDNVEFAAMMKDALENPGNYILTPEQCKALLSLIALGKKHVVSKTTDDGVVYDVALRPSLFLRLKALETLYASQEQSAMSLPVMIEVVPVSSPDDVARLKRQTEQSSQEQQASQASQASQSLQEIQEQQEQQQKSRQESQKQIDDNPNLKGVD